MKMNSLTYLVTCSLLLFLLVACATPAPTETAVPPAPPTAAPPTPDLTRDGWTLVWHDEFDGPEINADYWTHEIGGHGWGNGENQYYTDDPDNAFIEDGLLIIQALERNYLGKPFTSARLTTQGKVTQQYGRIEARIQIPTGKGIWPAFWMLGENFDTVGWPRSGEIDIMENIGSEPWVVHGTLHGPGYSGGSGVGAAYRLPDRSPFHANFHVYAVEWEPEEIRWYVDDALYSTITPARLPGDWVYDQPFFIILNVAVGGRWPGYPDATTEFPQRMLVDYVRIYERSNQ
jgi:beta-glucanase (GH16 family)